MTGEALQSHCMRASKQLYITAHLCVVLIGCWVSCSRRWTSSCSEGGTLPDCRICGDMFQILLVDHLVDERFVLHEWLSTVLLILGTSRVRRAVGTWYPHNSFASSSRLCPKCLWHGVLTRKLKKCDVNKWRSSWTHKIMVNDRWCNSMLFFIQTIFNCTGPIQALMLKSREVLNMGNWRRRWQVSCAE